MSEVCYDTSNGIVVEAIPGEDLSPAAMRTAATGLRSAAQEVREHGASAVHTWQGLSPHYEAPESAALLAVVDPVSANAHAFADAVDQVAAALDAYADEVAPIAGALRVIRTEARAFRRKIAGNSEWRYDQGLVDENTDLIGRVNAQQVLLWDAERACANRIRALYGAAPWQVADGSDYEFAYGTAEIGTDMEMPWGAEVQRQDHCPKAAAVGVKRFVWDGIVVDGIGGTLEGLGMLIGIDGNGWSWDTVAASWTGMAGLIGYADGEWSWGNAGDTWTAMGKGIISYDTWSEDPARAAGGSAFNILTVVLPAGAAVSGVKGASKAATAGRVGTFLQKGARVMDFVDPAALGIMGARAALPKLGDLAAGLRLTVGGALDEIRMPAPDRIGVDVPRVQDLHAPGVLRLGDDAAPTPRDPDVGSAGGYGGSQPAQVEVPAAAREHAFAGGPSAGSGTGADLAPGDVGRGADDLVQHGGGSADGAGQSAGGDTSFPRGDDDGFVRVGDHEGGPELGDGAAGGDVPSGIQELDLLERDFTSPQPAHSVDVAVADGPGSRTPFAARADLQPDTVYHVEGRGDFYTDASGRVVRVEATYGGTGNLNADLMNPQPDTTYVVRPDVTNPIGGVDHTHVFVTDGEGRTILAHTDGLSLGDADRAESVQARVGREGGEGFEGGHLFGNSFAGGGEYINHSAMLREINRGAGDSFFGLENQWRQTLKANPDARIAVDIQPVYSSGGRVPDKFVVKYRVDDGYAEMREFING